MLVFCLYSMIKWNSQIYISVWMSTPNFRFLIALTVSAIPQSILPIKSSLPSNCSGQKSWCSPQLFFLSLSTFNKSINPKHLESKPPLGLRWISAKACWLAPTFQPVQTLPPKMQLDHVMSQLKFLHCLFRLQNKSSSS